MNGIFMSQSYYTTGEVEKFNDGCLVIVDGICYKSSWIKGPPFFAEVVSRLGLGISNIHWKYISAIRSICQMSETYTC